MPLALIVSLAVAYLLMVNGSCSTVGVGECDKFVAAVAAVLTCESMPVEARAQLGNQTADFWDLPTHGLPADAQRRIADACDASRAQLEQEARDAGCTM